MSYGDYVEQLTFLLFLKMADERTKKPFDQKSMVPSGYAFGSEMNPWRTRTTSPNRL